jgi:hypothetical protein
MKRILALLLIAALTITTALADLSADAQTATLDRGRALTAMLYTAQLEPLWETLDADARDLYGKNFEEFKTHFQNAFSQLGKEQKLLEEHAYQTGEDVYYERIVQFTNSSERYRLLMVLKGNKVELLTLDVMSAPSAPPEGLARDAEMLRRIVQS